MENSISQTSLGFFGIINEFIKTTRRNAKVLGPTLVIVFFSFSFSDFAQTYMLAPFVEDFVLQLAKHMNTVQGFSYTVDKTIYDGALEDVRVIALIKLMCLISYSITTLTLLVLIILTLSGAYTAKVLDIKDINVVFMKSLKRLKRVLVTSFYISLLTLGIVCLYLISITITAILAVNSWALLLFGVITLSIPVCYVYVSTLWIVSTVVSIIEEPSGGFKAIGRATELIEGKRLQASLMMAPFAIAYGVVYLIDIALSSNNLSMSTQLAIRIPFTNGLLTLLTLFMFAVYTIFYRELKTCHDVKEGKGIYLPIVAGEA
ncbi:hypothetical protein L2E82_38933 [Cichorium intybus]|uniref:Uncharacterized protein n=1 Tax=Cichorium intybus TaxID=13427 RepID=A0ACB9AGL0_CICIN|nr:hypothetical protein L2E82_38933 [Cichorium intybus]